MNLLVHATPCQLHHLTLSPFAPEILVGRKQNISLKGYDIKDNPVELQQYKNLLQFS